MTPLVIGFDTATEAVTCGLWREPAVVAERLEAPSARGAQRVLAIVAELLAESRLSLADVGGIAVGLGPGSFTGIRVGIATARGLALGLDVPLTGASTLDVLLRGAPGCVALIDARRGEVFAAGCGVEPTALRPQVLVGLLAAGATAVGDGALRYRDVLEPAGVVVPAADDLRHRPRIGHLAGLAAASGGDGSIEAVYLRRPDAEAAAA